MSLFLDFRAKRLPSIFFNLNPFYHQQTLYFRVLNYEKHKEGTCKVSGRSVIFQHYPGFCLCPKSVIITTLKVRDCDFYAIIVKQSDRKFCMYNKFSCYDSVV